MREEYAPNENTGHKQKKELNRVETSNLLEQEFKVVFIKMFTGLEKE